MLYNIPGCLVKVCYQTQEIEVLLMSEGDEKRILSLAWREKYAEQLCNRLDPICSTAYKTARGHLLWLQDRIKSQKDISAQPLFSAV